MASDNKNNAYVLLRESNIPEHLVHKCELFLINTNLSEDRQVELVKLMLEVRDTGPQK